MEITEPEEQRKFITKMWTKLKGSVPYQMDQHKHWGDPGRRGEKEAERIFEEIIAETLPTLMKDVNVNTRETQWWSKTNPKNHAKTHYNQTIKSQRQKEFWKQQDLNNLSHTRNS